MNNCAFTVWPTARGAVSVLGTRGLELGPGSAANVSVPHAWIGNWSPRIGCHFDASGQGPCDTGGCGGGLACSEDASAVPMDRTQVCSCRPGAAVVQGSPCALTGAGGARGGQAEFNLNAWGNLDYYDLNLFTYNAAMTIRPASAACRPSGCVRDLLAHCPGGGAVADGSGAARVCRSACATALDVEHCLAPSAAAAQTKAACPYGTVSYMADHAVLACPGSPDYTVSFCDYLT